MTYQELQQWLAGHGGWKESIPTTRSVTKKTPAGDQTVNEAVTMVVAQDGSSVLVRVSGSSTKPEDNTYEAVEPPKLANTTANAQSTAKRDTLTINGRVMQWNPATEKFDIDLGSASTQTPGQVADDTRKVQEQVERERNQAAGYGPITDEQLGQKRNKWTEKSRTSDKRNGVTKIVINEENELGEKRTRDATETEVQEDKPITLKSGGFGRIKRDEAGNITGIEEIAVTPGARPEGQTRAKPLDVDATVAQGVAKGLASALTEVYNDDTIPNEERLRRAEALINQANVLMTEQSTAIAAQQNAYNSRVTQRSQDIGETASRRTWAQGTFQDILSTIGKGAGYMPAGSEQDIATALQGSMDLAYGYADRAGGFRDIPREVPGVAIQQTERKGLTGADAAPGTFQAQMPGAAPMPSFVRSSMPQPQAAAAGSIFPTGGAPVPGAITNGRGIIDQDRFNQLADQHGGLAGTENISQATAGDYFERPLYRYTMADGSILDMRDTPDGQLSEVQQYIPRSVLAVAPEN